MIVFLMKTKQLEAFCERIRVEIGMANSMYVNARGNSGDLELWWRSDVSVEFKQIKKNIIYSSVSLERDGEPMFIAWIYGDQEYGKRTHNWNQLRMIGINIR